MDAWSWAAVGGGELGGVREHDSGRPGCGWGATSGGKEDLSGQRLSGAVRGSPVITEQAWQSNEMSEEKWSSHWQRGTWYPQEFCLRDPRNLPHDDQLPQGTGGLKCPADSRTLKANNSENRWVGQWWLHRGTWHSMLALSGRRGLWLPALGVPHRGPWALLVSVKPRVTASSLLHHLHAEVG